MNLCINMLIEWLREDANSLIERLLWLDPSGTDLVTIDISLKNTRALPRLRTREEIELAYASAGIRTLNTDPFAKLDRSEAKIPADQREDRETAWQIIET